MYYSCKEHLDDLINSLEEDGKEKRLLSAMKTKYKVMVKHMQITEALTEASRGTKFRTVIKTDQKPIWFDFQLHWGKNRAGQTFCLLLLVQFITY